MRSWKLRFVLAALAIAPRLAVWLYATYERLHGRSDPVRH
jgi:hypothetical protein